MSNKTGPLTKRQMIVLDHLLLGKRHAEIAKDTGISLMVVRQEVSFVTAKMGAGTSTGAAGQYATARAYAATAARLLAGRIPAPVGDAEEHVNHVLEGLATIFQQKSDTLLPR
jgi:DNA-binding CsgD family transcriptional regulator